MWSQRGEVSAYIRPGRSSHLLLCPSTVFVNRRGVGGQWSGGSVRAFGTQRNTTRWVTCPCTNSTAIKTQSRLSAYYSSLSQREFFLPFLPSTTTLLRSQPSPPCARGPQLSFANETWFAIEWQSMTITMPFCKPTCLFSSFTTC